MCILLWKGEISVRGTDNAKKRNQKLTLRNNTPFRSCISKINIIFIGNAKGIDIIMHM